MSCNRSNNEILKLPHHEQQEFCTNRPYYRQGKKLTAVKVYTISDESVHLLVNNIPVIHLKNEIYKLCSRFGEIKICDPLPEFVPPQEFTETYHVQYARIQSARFAKRQIDGRSFFGSVIHVCYAPELETINETRQKLVRRRCEVAARVQQNSIGLTLPQIEKPRLLQRSKKHPALSYERKPLYGTENIFPSNNVAVSPSLILQNKNISDQRENMMERNKTDEFAMDSAVPENISIESTCCDNKVIKFLPKPVAIQRRIVFHNNKK